MHNEHDSRTRRQHGVLTTNVAKEEDRGTGAQEEEGAEEEENREKMAGCTKLF